MTAEFAPYVERRAKCGAFRFLESTDSEFVAHALCWDVRDWTLDKNGDSFRLEVITPNGVIPVNRGDFIVRDPDTYVATVVSARDFHPAWEPESSAPAASKDAW